MIGKLQRKFVAIAMLSLLLVLVILIGAINILNYRNLVSEADDTLELLLQNNGEFPMRGGRPEERLFERQGRRGKALSPELPFQSRYFSVSFDSNSGESVAVNVKNIFSVSESEAEAFAKRVYAGIKQKGFLQSYRFMKRSGDGTVLIVFLSCEREIATFQNFLLVSAIISLAGFSAVFLLIVLLSGRIVRPIGESYEKQKSFITDAGHELKTPIAIIRADVDVLETEQPQNEWLEDIRLQTERLASLTNDLIYLSKMEEEGVRLQMIDFPLSDAVTDTAAAFRSAAKAKNKALLTDIRPHLSMNGDEKAIRKLVSILLDNAVKYAAEGTTIRLSLEKNGRQTVLSVSNETDAVPKGNVDRLFDRFYRTDASRNAETGGFGLGLSVAKAVTEAHKGRIRAFSPDGASLTIEAIFTD